VDGVNPKAAAVADSSIDWKKSGVDNPNNPFASDSAVASALRLAKSVGLAEFKIDCGTSVEPLLVASGPPGAVNTDKGVTGVVAIVPIR